MLAIYSFLECYCAKKLSPRLGYALHDVIDTDRNKPHYFPSRIQKCSKQHVLRNYHRSEEFCGRLAALLVNKWKCLYIKLHSYLVSRSFWTTQQTSATTTLQRELHCDESGLIYHGKDVANKKPYHSNENQVVCRTLKKNSVTFK